VRTRTKAAFRRLTVVVTLAATLMAGTATAAIAWEGQSGDAKCGKSPMVPTHAFPDTALGPYRFDVQHITAVWENPQNAWHRCFTSP
jgi:hypothetical protein